MNEKSVSKMADFFVYRCHNVMSVVLALRLRLNVDFSCVRRCTHRLYAVSGP